MMNIDFETLADEQLDKLLKIANIAKINEEVDVMRTNTDLQIAKIFSAIEAENEERKVRLAKMETERLKLEAERIKAEKEAKLYPWVAVGLVLSLLPLLFWQFLND